MNTPAQTTSFALLVNGRPGEVYVTTSEIETYPSYRIRSGARLVVVENDMATRDPMVWARLLPADKHLMIAGDLQEWGDCVQLMPADPVHDSLPGVEADDVGNEGHAWTRYPLDAIRNDDAVPLHERIACVFTYLLEKEIGDDNMTNVVRLNRLMEDKTSCASHDFCDANMVMLQAFQEVDTPAPNELTDGFEEHEEACELWNAAWDFAAKHLFAIYDRPLPTEGVANDDEADAGDEMHASLCAVYEAWLKREGLNLGSADEHTHDESLTPEQRAWLVAFCAIWDASGY